MTTPTDDLAQALRELIPYAAECAACPGYRIKNARAALQAHESRANAASEEHECAYENGDGVCRECQALAAQTKAQPASVEDAEARLDALIYYCLSNGFFDEEDEVNEAIDSVLPAKIMRAAAPQPAKDSDNVK